MKSLEAYKVEIRPTDEQEVLLHKHCGLARYVYNWALRKHNDWWTRNKGVDEALRDPTDERPNATSLSRLWTQTKANRLEEDGTDWTKELMRNTVTYALKAVDDGFKHYFRRRKNKEVTRCRICIKFKRRWPCEHCYGYPRFKSADDREAFTIQDQSFRAEARFIKIGKLGMFKVCRPVLPEIRTDRQNPQGYWLRGRVLRIAVSRQADRWYACLMVERDRPDPVSVQGPVVGIDLGINHAATCSDGRVFEPAQVSRPARSRGAHDPNNGLNLAEQLLRQLGHLERIKARKPLGSKQRERVVDKIARLQKHIADARADHLHNASKLVSTTASVVVTEGYNVRELGMRTGPTRGQAHASDTRRRMMQTGLGELRRQLEYKAKWYGSRFEKTAADYPSNMTCSVCGHVNEHVRERRDSRFDCEKCGHTSTRQTNTADLLARLGRGDPFDAAPNPPRQSSTGRKPRRGGPAGHAGTDTPGGASTSHAASASRGAAPVKGEARTTEEPLGLTDADGGTP